jgi:hypothetical protein
MVGTISNPTGFVPQTASWCDTLKTLLQPHQRREEQTLLLQGSWKTSSHDASAMWLLTLASGGLFNAPRPGVAFPQT